MYTFLESLKTALPLGAVRKDEGMGRADIKTGKSTLALFMPCLRHNTGNRRDGEK